MKERFNASYLAISGYAIATFVICMVLYKTIDNWAASTAFLASVAAIFAPVTYSLVMAYFISPLVNFLERKWIRKWRIGPRRLRNKSAIRVFGIFFAYLVILGVLVVLLAVIVPQLVNSITDIATKLPSYAERLLAYLESATVPLGNSSYYLDFSLVSAYINENLPQTLEQYAAIVSDMAPRLIDFLRTTASVVWNITFGFIISIYLVFSKEKAVRGLHRFIFAAFSHKTAISLLRTLHTSNRTFSRFFIGKAIDSLIIGTLCFIILIVVGIPYPMLLSVIVGVTNMIPYFGPLIGGAIGIMFLILASPIEALWFAIIILALQQFDGNVLGPFILGDSTGLSPFWVIFAIIVFGGIWGILGMFIGVPCFAVLKTITDGLVERKYRSRVAALRERKTEAGKL